MGNSTRGVVSQAKIDTHGECSCSGDGCSDCDEIIWVQEDGDGSGDWFFEPDFLGAIYESIADAKAGAESRFGVISWWEEEPEFWMGEVGGSNG